MYGNKAVSQHMDAKGSGANGWTGQWVNGLVEPVSEQVGGN